MLESFCSYGVDEFHWFSLKVSCFSRPSIGTTAELYSLMSMLSDLALALLAPIVSRGVVYDGLSTRVRLLAANDRRDPLILVVAGRSESFEREVASLQLPLVVLFEQQRADEAVAAIAPLFGSFAVFGAGALFDLEVHQTLCDVTEELTEDIVLAPFSTNSASAILTLPS
jgi:hypothetical protein